MNNNKNKTDKDRLKAAFANIDTWIFDLDKTVYPATSSLFKQIDKLICSYICKKFHMASSEAFMLQKRYYRKYGTTLRGLINDYNVDPEEFLYEAHQLNLDEILFNESLDRSLQGLHGKKIIFTNGPKFHAERILEKLGIMSHFEDIFDIKDANYISKPDKESYKMFTERYNIIPHNAVFFEDSYRNLPPAAELGITTVWVRNESNWRDDKDIDKSFCHFVTDDLMEFLEELVLALRAY